MEFSKVFLSSKSIFNKFSVVIIITYFLLVLLMSDGTLSNILELSKITILPILICILWSSSFSKKTQKKDSLMNKRTIFHQDFFLVFYAFYLGGLISTISNYLNPDVMVWWYYFVNINFIYAILFALFYSLISILIKKNKFYTYFFSLLTFLFISSTKFWPQYLNLKVFGQLETFFVIPIIFLLIHLLYCLGKKIN